MVLLKGDYCTKRSFTVSFYSPMLLIDNFYNVAWRWWTQGELRVVGCLMCHFIYLYVQAHALGFMDILRHFYYWLQ